MGQHHDRTAELDRQAAQLADESMPKNVLYLILGALIVALVGLGIYTYREQTRPDGVEINIGEDGVSIEGN